MSHSLGQGVCVVSLIALFTLSTGAFAADKPATRPATKPAEISQEAPRGGGGIGPQGEWGQQNPDIVSKSVVFVFDVTRASIGGEHSILANEMLKAIGALKQRQEIGIILTGTLNPITLDPKQVPATEVNKKRVGPFLTRVLVPEKPMSPLPVIRAGLAREPDLIFLVVDHAWTDPATVLKAIKESPKRAKKINVIYYISAKHGEVDKATEAGLEKIAKESNGLYKLVKEIDLDVSDKPTSRPAK